MIRSGVAASDVAFGALFFASAATDFSDAGGISVAPPEGAGAPGSVAGSDIVLSLLYRVEMWYGSDAFRRYQAESVK